METKYYVYGAVGIGAFALFLALRGGGGGGNPGVTAITASGNMANAVANNNKSAYDYLGTMATAQYDASKSIYNGNSFALSDTLKEVSANIASGIISSRDASNVRNSSVAAVRVAQFDADTRQLMSNNDYLLGKQELENDAKFIGLQLPLAQIAMDTTLRSIGMNNATAVNIATINANRDVALQHEVSTADMTVASSWASAAVSQAYYAYKSAKAQANAAKSAFGALSFKLPGGASASAGGGTTGSNQNATS